MSNPESTTTFRDTGGSTLIILPCPKDRETFFNVEYKQVAVTTEAQRTILGGIVKVKNTAIQYNRVSQLDSGCYRFPETVAAEDFAELMRHFAIREMYDPHVEIINEGYD